MKMKTYFTYQSPTVEILNVELQDILTASLIYDSDAAYGERSSYSQLFG